MKNIWEASTGRYYIVIYGPYMELLLCGTNSLSKRKFLDLLELALTS